MHSAYDGYTFPLSEGVTRTKVHFTNRYGIELTGDLYAPKDAKGKLPALAVCGPFGAVKEQASGLYADEMASRGFIALAFDPSFIGESGGDARNVASPDINTEDFCAAVDFLSVNDQVNPDQIGIIGICGFGGMALNAAAMDTRIKATVTSTMYDMSRVNANGYFDDADNADARYEMKVTLNNQRTEDYKNGSAARAGGVADELPADAPFYVKDYFDYYKTERGYSERSLNSNDGWNTTSSLSFINMPILAYSDEIRSAVLMIHGEDAHSVYFTQDAFKKLTGDNKELLILPGTVHTDLYDKKDKIPFDKIEVFFNQYLKGEAPKTEAPESKTETPKTEAPKTEAPKTDTDTAKTEAPKTDTDTAKTEAPKTDTDTAKTEAPESEAPKTETDAPKAETSDTAKTDAPESEAPKTETNAPKAETK